MGLTSERQFARPPKTGKLTVLLIADPTGDLPGATEEAEAVKHIIHSQNEHLALKELRGNEATVQSVTAALAQADIVHYCGYASFDESLPDAGGLLLAGRALFTGYQLRAIELLPHFAFINGGKTGRTWERRKTLESASFAGLFLRGGIDAYLGTNWTVEDRAAALFAKTLYTQLVLGATLETAVREGRNVLFEENKPDWANYVLFGSGNFRLVVRE